MEGTGYKPPPQGFKAHRSGFRVPVESWMGAGVSFHVGVLCPVVLQFSGVAREPS